ncbi:Major Facilitator Superfamily protein [Aphelenchoides avenae]|nr:Major Facilitator Superfamily protein [Aphelenchus avenae]
MLGMMMTYMSRSNTSVAIVCMTNATYLDLGTNRTVPECRRIESSTLNETDKSRKDGTFTWDKKKRSIVLSAFYYSYWTTKFPGGVLVRYIGPKWIIFGVVLGSAIFNILTPILVVGDSDHGWFVADRVLLGAVQGAAFPVMQQMLSSWAPPAERSTIAGIVYTGSQFGIVLAHLLSLVCDDIGWGWIYYITGIMGCVWCVLWVLLIADSPEKQHCMSEAEKNYITDALAATRNKKTVPFCKVPWRKIATSMPVYAVCVAQFSMDFGAFTIAQYDVLRLPLGHTGVLVAIPFAGKMVMIFVSGIVADKVHKRGWLSLVNTRRAAMITGAQYSAHASSYLDIAPAYAGIIVGIANSLSSISGALGPQLMGVMTKESTPEQWRGFFGLNIGVVLTGATFYCIFIQAHPQPWAVNPEAETIESMTTSTPGSDTSTGKSVELSSSIESSENTEKPPNRFTVFYMIAFNKLLRN